MMPEKRQFPSAQPDWFGVVLSPDSLRHGSICSDDELNVRHELASAKSRTCATVMFAAPVFHACSALLGSQATTVTAVSAASWFVVAALAPRDRARHLLLLACISS